MIVNALGSNCRNGIHRIVGETVGRFCKGWVDPEGAIAVKGIRSTATAQEKRCVAGPRQRPFILIPPSAVHHENPHSALALDTVIDILEPVVEPSILKI